MGRKLLIGVFVLILFAGGYYFWLSRKNPAVNEEETEGEVSKVAVAEILKEAGKMEQEGKLLDARRLYRKIIAQYPQETEAVSVALKKEQALNMKVLFSPIPDEFSTVYEVKPGDTLSRIAEEFGTTVEMIKKANDLKNNIIHPKQKLKVCNQKFSIFIDKSQNILILKADDRIVKTYTVATGKDNTTPVGTFKIAVRLSNPTWYKKGKVVPPGDPENVLGKYWLGFNLQGYGIHGTNDESVMGKQVTEGCVRMRNKDVEELFSLIPVGTEVTIVD